MNVTSTRTRTMSLSSAFLLKLEKSTLNALYLLKCSSTQEIHISWRLTRIEPQLLSIEAGFAKVDCLMMYPAYEDSRLDAWYATVKSLTLKVRS